MTTFSEHDLQIYTRLLDFVDTVDMDWLKELGSADLIKAALESVRGRRLLMRWLLDSNNIVPDDIALNDSQSWLLLSRKDLHALASRLGEYAYAHYLRKIVDRKKLHIVRGAINGEYLKLINHDAMQVSGLDEEQFKHAIEDGYLTVLFIATGVACLRLTVINNDFYMARLQWSFPKNIWNFITHDLSLDIDELSALSLQLQLQILGVDHA